MQPEAESLTEWLVDSSPEPGVHFHAGLSDCKAIIGESAVLECKLSSEECEGIWYKDGEEVSNSSFVLIMKQLWSTVSKITPFGICNHGT